MSRPALALLVLVLVPYDLAAQDPQTTTIRGVVVAEDSGEPLHGVWVSLGSSDQGALTDIDGRFHLRDIPSGPDLLTIERLGYESQVLPVQVADSLIALRVRLAPHPVVLEGLRVVFDRFERRRNATAMSVRYFDEADLISAAHGDAVRFLRSRAGLFFTPCRSIRIVANLCLRRRGQLIAPAVYIDERRTFGLDELRIYHPSEFYMIEVYGSGAQIRAYTRWFMERAAETRLQPIPLFW